MAGNLFSALGMLSVTVLILALAYWTTRRIGAHAAPGAPGWFGGAGNDNFRVLARIGVGRGACLMVVRLRERCLLLGVTEYNVALLKEWEGGDADAWLSQTPADGGFLDALRGVLQDKRDGGRPRRNRREGD